MSKVTGVPMVDLAVRIALGERLRGPRLAGRAPPGAAFVAVKAPAFSTAKLRGRGPVARAVHAVDRRGDRAPRGCAGWRRPRRWSAASLVPPRPGPERGAGAPVGRRPRQGAAWPRWPAALDVGPATGSPRPPARGRRSRRRARRRGPSRSSAAQAGARRGPDPRPDRVGRGPARRQHADARAPARSATPPRSAWRRSPRAILCLTAIETAVAAAEALDPAVIDRLAEVRPLGEWVPQVR